MGTMLNAATTFDPNGTLRQVTAGPAGGAVGLAAPGLPGGIEALLAARAAQQQQQRELENQRANRALTLQEWEAQQQENRANAAAKMQAGQVADAKKAAMLAPNGTPVYAKTVGGAGITPGTIRLNQWEPGAAFAGYSGDLGEGPKSATMSPVAGNQQAQSQALSADDYNQFAAASGADPRAGNQRRGASYSGSYGTATNPRG